MSSFNHKVLGHTFRITVSAKKDGIWTRYIAVALCPVCKDELYYGVTGRIQKETEVKSSAKGGVKHHLGRVHGIK